MSKIELGTNAFQYLGFTDDDLDMLEDMASRGGDYAAACHVFVMELKDRNQHELTFKQIDWANRIKDKLEDKRRRS